MPKILERAQASAQDAQLAREAATWLANTKAICERRRVRVDIQQNCDDDELRALTRGSACNHRGAESAVKDKQEQQRRQVRVGVRVSQNSRLRLGM
jgi:hypothetical protein